MSLNYKKRKRKNSFNTKGIFKNTEFLQRKKQNIKKKKKKKLRTQNSDTNLEAYFTGGVALLVTPPLYTIPVCKLKTRKQKKDEILLWKTN